MHSGTSFLSMAFAAVFAFFLGRAYQSTAQHFADHRGAKARAEAARTMGWGSIPRVIKFMVIMGLGLVLTGWWAYRDVQDGATKTPLIPAATATPIHLSHPHPTTCSNGWRIC